MNKFDMETTDIRSRAQLFLNAHKFLELLRKYKNDLNWQEVRTLRGQALSGDVEGAYKGLERILGRR